MSEALGHAESARERAPGLPWVDDCAVRLAQRVKFWAPLLGLELLQADPANAQVMMYLAQSYERLGQEARALAWARRASAIAPSDMRLRKILGVGRGASGPGTVVDGVAAAAIPSGGLSAERSESK